MVNRGVPAIIKMECGLCLYYGYKIKPVAIYRDISR
jgi:hypothetical protein